MSDDTKYHKGIFDTYRLRRIWWDFIGHDELNEFGWPRSVCPVTGKEGYYGEWTFGKKDVLSRVYCHHCKGMHSDEEAAAAAKRLVFRFRHWRNKILKPWIINNIIRYRVSYVELGEEHGFTHYPVTELRPWFVIYQCLKQHTKEDNNRGQWGWDLPWGKPKSYFPRVNRWWITILCVLAIVLGRRWKGWVPDAGYPDQYLVAIWGTSTHCWEEVSYSQGLRYHLDNDCEDSCY